MNRIGAIVKRAIDVAGASVGLVVLSPVLAGAAVAVYATMGRPILFRHERPGHRGVAFTLHKFRTMRPPREGEIYFRTGGQRLTPVGRFLRATSIDELPELWDVLRGKMSLVGPRPLLMEYMSRYTPEQRRRHDVRPGITGWAQVNGRDTLKFSQRIALDLWYVDHQSLALDMRILARTALQAFTGADVVHGQVPEDVDDLGLAGAPPQGKHGTNGVHAR